MVRLRLRPRRIRLGRDARRRLTVAALLLVSLGLLWLPRAATDAVRLYAGPLFYPFQGYTQEVIRDLTRQFRDPDYRDVSAEEAARLRQENEALENALARSAALTDRYRQLLREVTQIRTALEGWPCRIVPARLLAPEFTGGRVGARLDAGNEHGVTKGSTVVTRYVDRGDEEIARGQAVLTAAGLVGVVEAVGPRMSTVRLLADPQSRLTVQIIARRADRWLAGPEAVAGGSPDGTGIVLTTVHRGHDVQAGDFVVTSPSPESPVPPYLIVGQIAECRLEPASLFYTIRVKPRVALADLGDVYVLVPVAAERPGS